MTEVTLQVVGIEAVSAAIAVESARIQRRIRKVIRSATIEVQQNAVTTYLEGPRPKHLERKSGHLAASINQRVEEVGPEIVGRVGTNLPYGRFWEKGFSGKQEVAAFQRITRFATKGGKFVHQSDLVYGPSRRAAYSMRVFAKKGARNRAESMGMVKAHSRNVNQPARPFLRPALDDLRTGIRARIADAVNGRGEFES